MKTLLLVLSLTLLAVTPALADDGGYLGKLQINETVPLAWDVAGAENAPVVELYDVTAVHGLADGILLQKFSGSTYAGTFTLGGNIPGLVTGGKYLLRAYTYVNGAEVAKTWTFSVDPVMCTLDATGLGNIQVPTVTGYQAHEKVLGDIWNWVKRGK